MVKNKYKLNQSSRFYIHTDITRITHEILKKLGLNPFDTDSWNKHYEGTYFPDHIENDGKASYVERNYEKINCSKYSAVYYDENYLFTKA